nr:MAG TPA: hypothetical protein [Caudoviricetes sp.]
MVTSQVLPGKNGEVLHNTDNTVVIKRITQGRLIP